MQNELIQTKKSLDEANQIVVKTNKNLEEALKRPKFEQEQLEDL